MICSLLVTYFLKVDNMSNSRFGHYIMPQNILISIEVLPLKTLQYVFRYLATHNIKYLQLQTYYYYYC